MKIKDLPKNETISSQETKRARGGAFEMFLKIDGVCGKSVDPLPLEEVSFASPGANVRAIIDIPT